MKNIVVRNPRKGPRPLILVLAREYGENIRLKDSITKRLAGYEVEVVKTIAPEAFIVHDNHIDLIVITTLFRESPTKIRRIVSNASIVCPESQFIIFATDLDSDPHDARVQAVISHSNYDALGTAIRKRFPLP